MRNYPLFKNTNKAATPANWQKTYVDFLDMQTKSLVDYSNYFLADYRVGPDFIRLDRLIEDLPCFSIEKLRYHQYRDTIEEGYYFLKSEDVQDITKAKKIPTGCHVINNNQKESGDVNFKNWENIAISPMGYAAYYIITFSNGRLVFRYTKNAQLYYGNDQTLSILDFYTRFFYAKNNDYAYDISDKLQQKSIDVFSTSGGEPVIVDKQSFQWTDTEFNPIMGFTYIKDNNNSSLGEEIIIDSKESWGVKVEKFGVATYTIEAKGAIASGDNYWPTNTKVYLL